MKGLNVAVLFLLGVVISIGAYGTEKSGGKCRWHELGPRDVPDGEGFGGASVSVSGRVTAVAVAEKSGKIFVGSALGGVWVSVDRGQSWRPLTDDAPSLAVGAIGIDPLNEKNIYVGTGEGNIALRSLFVRHDRPISGQRGAGILKSINGGLTWSNIGQAEFGDSAFFFLKFEPSDRNTLYAGTNVGLFRTNDKGKTWTKITLPTHLQGAVAVTSLAIDPSSKRAYVGVFGVGVLQCQDLNAVEANCQVTGNGLPRSNISRVEVAIGEKPPFTVVSYISDAAGSLRGFYFSDDKGGHWSRASDAPDLFQGQGFYNAVLSVDPMDSGVVFLGGAGNRDIHKSSLFKARRIEAGWVFAPVGSDIHIDLHTLVFDASFPGTLYVGSDGGIWVSQDEGLSWRSLNRGLGTFQVIRFDQHPRREDTLIVGTQDNGTLRFSADSGWTHVDNGDGGYVAISLSRPEVVYDEYMQFRIARSDHEGARGTFVPSYPTLRFPRSVFLAPFIVDPTSEGKIFLGLEKLYLTVDGGKSWNAITLDLSKGWTNWLETNAISSISLVSEDRLAVGTSDGRLWLISRQESVWHTDEFKMATPEGTPGYISSILFSELHPQALIVGSDETGTSSLWTCNILSFICDAHGLSGLPTGPIFSLESLGPNVIVAGTEIGVFRSLDYGESWKRWSDGLPRIPVFQLQRHQQGNLVRAGTFGRGIWERSLVPGCE